MKTEIVLAVTVRIDADSVREAERLFDQWMRGAEDDERLIWYRIDTSRTGEVTLSE